MNSTDVMPDEYSKVPPTPPAGEERANTNAALNHVLDAVSAFMDDLQAVQKRHAEAAPVSSGHIQNLVGLVALSTLTWIEEWPS